ncbi:MAG TPA: hypothetical protein VFE46_09675 [Pirellulales bacterium]|jgi:hypothetical protein|nr:hypothetical protein [Pirellulales bacterium]
MIERTLQMNCFVVWFPCLLFTFCLVGCAENVNSSDQVSKAVAAVNTSNIQRLANLYSAFQLDHYGAGPHGELEFKQFITDVMGPAHLTLMQIDPHHIDTVFMSERDHQPFRVKYGLGGGPGAVNAVIFEEQGIAGKRQVAFNGGKVEEVEDARYQELLNGDQTVSPAADPGG